jgi:hypothetical protein
VGNIGETTVFCHNGCLWGKTVTDGTPDVESPNKAIDARIKKLLKECEGQPIDVQVKVVNSAISWEKVKHGITEKGDTFDPDQL